MARAAASEESEESSSGTKSKRVEISEIETACVNLENRADAERTQEDTLSTKLGTPFSQRLQEVKEEHCERYKIRSKGIQVHFNRCARRNVLFVSVSLRNTLTKRNCNTISNHMVACVFFLKKFHKKNPKKLSFKK